MNESIRARLQEYCSGAFPDRAQVEVGELWSVGAGWESELYAFTLEYGPASGRVREALVLRAYQGEGSAAKASHEFHSLRRLYQAGYPVPRVDRLEQESILLGTPFILMEYIAGEALWPRLSLASQGEQQELLHLFCGLFVRLHRLDWRAFVEPDDGVCFQDAYIFLDRWFSTARELLDQSPRVRLLPVVEWLERRRDRLFCRQPSPVHNDFHPANVLLRADGSAVVIDWTGFGVSDSRFDLAWTLVLAGAYAGPGLRDRILREYERQAGAPVEEIGSFEVFACCRRLFDIAVSLLEGPERRGMRPEASAAMKEQLEAARRVYELLVGRTGIRVTDFEALLEPTRQ